MHRIPFALLVFWCAAVPAVRAQDVCKNVLDAGERLTTTPHHGYMTRVRGNKQELLEDISVDGAIYIQINGKWRKSPLTVQDRLKQQQENRASAKNTSCRHVRDEAVNGEPADVYSVHAENEGITSDSMVWISKSKNQILRQEEDIDETDTKFHESVRYEYTNVAAPPVSR
ncbi:MAG: hypothetical protein LAO19_11585 [Acidobacteriia bacterium]|nr:hypothetical protein [Terriglobia bacterium]